MGAGYYEPVQKRETVIAQCCQYGGAREPGGVIQSTIDKRIGYEEKCIVSSRKTELTAKSLRQLFPRPVGIQRVGRARNHNSYIRVHREKHNSVDNLNYTSIQLYRDYFNYF